MRIGSRPLVVALLLSIPYSAAHAQWLYVSPDAIDCTVDQAASVHGGSYPLRLHAPGHGDATSVMFRLEIDGLGTEDEVIIAPEPGVTFAGDVRTLATVTFTPRTLEHAQLLTLSFVDHDPPAQPWSGAFVFIGVRDAVLFAGGTSIMMDNMDAWRVDCFDGGGLDFQPPKSPEVTIGKTTLVTFMGMSTGGYWGPGATSLVANDNAGWVTQLSDPTLWNFGCGACPWFWQPLVLTVTVPGDVTEGATSVVSVSEGAFTFTQFSLTAIAPTATQATTWGAVKALYR